MQPAQLVGVAALDRALAVRELALERVARSSGGSTWPYSASARSDV